MSDNPTRLPRQVNNSDGGLTGDIIQFDNNGQNTTSGPIGLAPQTAYRRQFPEIVPARAPGASFLTRVASSNGGPHSNAEGSAGANGANSLQSPNEPSSNGTERSMTNGASDTTHTNGDGNPGER